MRTRKGFTLIELLIVVVIIGILAAIAIPKFANTKQKAYVTSMKSDLRNLVTAQEAYFADSSQYTGHGRQPEVPEHEPGVVAGDHGGHGQLVRVGDPLADREPVQVRRRHQHDEPGRDGRVRRRAGLSVSRTARLPHGEEPTEGGDHRTAKLTNTEGDKRRRQGGRDGVERRWPRPSAFPKRHSHPPPPQPPRETRHPVPFIATSSSLLGSCGRGVFWLQKCYNSLTNDARVTFSGAFRSALIDTISGVGHKTQVETRISPRAFPSRRRPLYLGNSAGVCFGVRPKKVTLFLSRDLSG